MIACPLEAAQYTFQANLASLAQANATFTNAEINVGYTKIYSPSNGVLGILRLFHWQRQSPFNRTELMPTSAGFFFFRIINQNSIYGRLDFWANP
ncbi:hypothetical protein IEE83_17160 [Dyadobacter sp. UP-52]|uniref:Uncharacterized protein n=1 Tax=Dyadobacter subterraneus TaxID=2773304 RepID=A0ABR9WDR5_9BACT|nr:hypothetical protein [Dyadobacter subterraneus]